MQSTYVLVDSVRGNNAGSLLLSPDDKTHGVPAFRIRVVRRHADVQAEVTSLLKGNIAFVGVDTAFDRFRFFHGSGKAVHIGFVLVDSAIVGIYNDLLRLMQLWLHQCC